MLINKTSKYFHLLNFIELEYIRLIFSIKSVLATTHYKLITKITFISLATNENETTNYMI